VAAAASQLGDLHTDRNRADYQLDRTDVERPADARAVIGKAVAVIQALDAAFAGPNRAQLVTAIQAWRRGNGYP
jgi:hypothetical protein